MDLLEILSQTLPKAATPFGGSGSAASRRREQRDRGQLHATHRPGQAIRMSRGRVYLVDDHGAYRRVDRLSQTEGMPPCPPSD
jgi:hypothetical protein